MEELNKSHVTDIEHNVEVSFDRSITLPVTVDGRDIGVDIYVGQTKIGKWAIGAVNDDRIRDIAGRISLTGKCLPSGTTDPVHLHDDGTWWFWDETWANEYGPYDTKKAAELKVDEYCRTELASGDAKEIPNDVWHAFHKVWTWCVGRPGYDKAQFVALEKKLFEATKP